jgi:hypothetical protein
MAGGGLNKKVSSSAREFSGCNVVKALRYKIATSREK